MSTSDSRFTRLKSDPRFRSIKRHKNKVPVDSRFSSVFVLNKSKFIVGHVDKYGRQLSDSQENENLRRFYRLDSENRFQFPTGPDYARGEMLLESSDEEIGGDASDGAQSSDDDNGDDIITLGRDTNGSIPVLEGGDVEVDLDENVSADVNARATLDPKTAPRDEQESLSRTRRIAIVDLDWDYIRATHLYKIFTSTISPVKSSSSNPVSLPAVWGKVLSVRIYPSKFGLERMAHEENGPPLKLFKKKKTIDGEEVNEKTIYETGNADEYDEDALRQYQLERLRYYYAIVECGTVQLASHLYSMLQGAELERSANVLNLSFVPDDMTFEVECRDQATSVIESTNYQPLDFATDALRHSKVKLTWDQDDPERDRVTRRTLSLKEIEENDFRAYIASSSDSSEHDTKPIKKHIDREKLRALLLSGEGNDLPEGWGGGKTRDMAEGHGDVDMEVTFRPALSGEKDEDETTLGRYQRKLREKRKKRRQDLKEKVEGKPISDDFFAQSEEEDIDGASVTKQRGETRKPSTKEELSLLVAPDQPDLETKHFDMATIIKAEKSEGKKRKGRKKKENGNHENDLQDNFTIDVKDERFRALHEDYAFAIDPTNPHFKKTRSMSTLLEERSKRKNARDGAHTAVQVPKSGALHSLSRLVESVKRKGTVTVEDGDIKRRKL
ncbi:hypothetical protein B0F90DRAFT_1807324 [Multifurca ochricompacta]|uniref:NUC153 domain-containing protein n=1 Tax=Multifurca ochricompacta TaxID=376703 RepID=A0AAD4MDA1_9AGAM|nr:hypothetical protein B0F90DRAFT_1807324 [Multifurca ochricompacta]